MEIARKLPEDHTTICATMFRLCDFRRCLLPQCPKEDSNLRIKAARLVLQLLPCGCWDPGEIGLVNRDLILVLFTADGGRGAWNSCRHKRS